MVRVRRVPMSISSICSPLSRRSIDPREEHRVHLGRVVAPHDQHVAGVEIVVAARRFVDAVAREKAGDRRRHAQPGIGVDVVVAQARLHELIGRRSFADRPLAGPIKGETFGAAGNLARR